MARRLAEEIGAVDRIDVEAGKRSHQPGDVAARRLELDRHRDRVAVVFDQEQHRQAPQARRADRFPELAFARGAFAERGEHDFVGLEPRRAIGDGGDAAVDDAGVGGADSVQDLGAGRARSRDDVERLVAPVRRHLTAARARIEAAADRREQHLERRDAELQAQARDRDSTGRTSRRPACSVRPAAIWIASWPAPLIWKKILLCCLSWISLSSSLRDNSIRR